jgi:hypothetical protein
MKCEICGLDPSTSNLPIFRTNPLGEIGIWRCWEHLSPDQKTDVDPGVKEITSIIEGDSK